MNSVMPRISSNPGSDSASSVPKEPRKYRYSRNSDNLNYSNHLVWSTDTMRSYKLKLCTLDACLLGFL